jgi:hypothetical protein
MAEVATLGGEYKWICADRLAALIAWMPVVRVDELVKDQ